MYSLSPDRDSSRPIRLDPTDLLGSFPFGSIYAIRSGSVGRREAILSDLSDSFSEISRESAGENEGSARVRSGGSLGPDCAPAIPSGLPQ